MRALFKFFSGKEGDEQLDVEFRRLYQDPGASFLGIGLGMALLTFGGFYVLDWFFGVLPAVGGVQTTRLIVIGVLSVLVLVCVLKRDQVARHYTIFGNVVMFGAMQAAAHVAYHARNHLSFAELYWGITSSLCTGIVCVYAFSRLTARNTALLAAISSLTGVAYTLAQEPHPQQIGRVVAHLVVVNIAGFALRRMIENRERTIFLLGKEALASSRYAKELEEAKRQAEAGSEAKSRFLANMCHEVRTPLSGIVQTLDAIEDECTPAGRHLVARARGASESLLRVLKGILDYSRLARGAQALTRVPVSLPALMESVVALHRPAAAAKGLDIGVRLDLGPQGHVVMTDEVRVLEILNNLVSNAIKFTPQGAIHVMGQLTARPDAPFPAAELRLKVQDTGIGIAAEHHEKVFEQFWQVDAGPNRHAGGTGLGLAIVKASVEAMGGTIALNSAPGVGTAMCISLPVDLASYRPDSGPPMATELMRNEAGVAANDDTLARPRLAESAGWRGQFTGRVLLAEDNELNVYLASRMLESMGFDVEVAENGRAALEALSRLQVDVVLMDCQMPVMDGYEAARRIRDSERRSGTPPVPIIAVTANTLAGDRERCLEAGMTDYLGKPYAPEELCEILHRCLPATMHREVAEEPVT